MELEEQLETWWQCGRGMGRGLEGAADNEGLGEGHVGLEQPRRMEVGRRGEGG